MRDFDDSTLWEASDFNVVRQTSPTSGFARLDGPTTLSSALLAELGHRRIGGGLSPDPLEVAAACMRQREAALLFLQCDGLVWPVTLFPEHHLYHSPRDLAHASLAGLALARVLDVEPPGVRAPGPWMREGAGHVDHYRPLRPMLWSLALNGPRAALLPEIAGPRAYRALRNPADEGFAVSGALGSAVDRLRRETVSLRTICEWPGMSAERAGRLLNALYLVSGLLATQTHPAAGAPPTSAWGRLGGGQRRQ